MYGPLTLLWFFNALLYVLILKKASQANSMAFRKIVQRLGLFVLASLLSNIPALMNRIQNGIQPKYPIFILFLLQGLFTPLQGFWNAIVYYSSAPLREAYLRTCIGCCPSCILPYLSPYSNTARQRQHQANGTEDHNDSLASVPYQQMRPELGNGINGSYGTLSTHHTEENYFYDNGNTNGLESMPRLGKQSSSLSTSSSSDTLGSNSPTPADYEEHTLLFPNARSANAVLDEEEMEFERYRAFMIQQHKQTQAPLS